jgi:manganese/iron transport system substrate-binding protein
MEINSVMPSQIDLAVVGAGPHALTLVTHLMQKCQKKRGKTIDLKCLIDAGSDPHVYTPKPDDRKAIEQAKLILYSGYDFEPSLIRLIKASSNKSAKIAVGEAGVPKALEFEEDGKKVSDPHA